jgi:hypothetical protein
MERLLLLWDELDEYVGMGRHLVAGAVHGLSCRRAELRLRLHSAYASSVWALQRAAGRAFPADKT